MKSSPESLLKFLLVVLAATLGSGCGPEEPIDLDVDTSHLSSYIGQGNTGFYGPFNIPTDGFEPDFFIPRCYPPAGASILDFDTDRLFALPDSSGYPMIQNLRGEVRTAIDGTISPRQVVSFNDFRDRSVIHFNQPQRYFGLHIGDRLNTGTPIELIAYDETGDVIAVDRIPVAEQNVSTCMAVRSFPDPAISYVALRPETDTRLDYDRIFFSAEGDLDAPPTPAGGTVEFIRPLDGDHVRASLGQLVAGRVTIPSGLNIDTVALTVPSWDRLTSEMHFASFSFIRESGGEKVYFFSVSRVFVPTGASWVSVTATGPGVRASSMVEVVGEGPPRIDRTDIVNIVDIEPITMEVTQAIRGPVDLIPPGTTINERSDTVLVHNKKTVVRAFARLAFPEDPSPGVIPGLAVNAELIGTKDGRTLPGSPLMPWGNRTTDLYEYASRSNAYHTLKQKTDRSWNFVLPDSWTNEGEIDLQLEVNAPHLEDYFPEHRDYDGPLNRIGLRNVTFRSQQHPSVRIWSIDYWWRCPYDSTFGRTYSWSRRPDVACARRPSLITRMQPTDAEILESVRNWWNMSPFPGDMPSSFRIFDYSFADAGSPPEPTLEPGSTIDQFLLGLAFRGVLVSNHDYSRFNALVSSFVRGRAHGIPSVFRATATPDGSVMTHEANHTMGLRHTGGSHGASHSILRWSGDHGEISNGPQASSAFNARTMQALPFDTFRGAHNERHDIMAYGSNDRWPSWEVWHHMEDVVGSNLVRIDNRLDNAHYGAPGGEYDGAVIVSGELIQGDVAFNQGFIGQPAIVGDGDMRLEVLDANANVLTETKSQSFFAYDSDEQASSFLIPALIDGNAAEIVLYKDGQEITREPVTPAPGSVALNAPQYWPANSEVQVSWNTDNNTSASYLLEVSRNGENWYTLARTSNLFTTIDTNVLPFEGQGWQLRVQASSGFRATVSNTLWVNFPVKPLTATIMSPLEGDRLSTNDPVKLQAAIPEFAEADPATIQWIINNQIVATGMEGTTAIRTPGNYSVRLSIPQSNFERQVNITVIEDKDGDGLEDGWEMQWGLSTEDYRDAAEDVDGDGLYPQQEMAAMTNPFSADSDGDDFGDGIERNLGTNPNDAENFPPDVFENNPVPRISDGQQ